MPSFNRNFPCASVTISILYTSVPVIWVHCHCCACYMHRATVWISCSSGSSKGDTADLPFCHLGAAGTFIGSASLEKGDYQATDWVHSCGYTAVWSRINTVAKWKLLHPLFQPFLSATSLMSKAVLVQLHTSQVSKRDHAQKMAHPRECPAWQLFDSSHCAATWALVPAQEGAEVSS